MGVCGRRTKQHDRRVSDQNDEPPEEALDDEDARALRKRDRTFLFRLGLRLTVALLFGVWIALSLAEADVGGCAAQGFQTVSE